MARTRLDTQLQEIRTKIIELGTLVETALSQALQAVQSGDQALCALVIASDTTIDGLRFEVDRLAFQSLTLQQPLAGHDLRFLSSVLSITTDLERMGDNATGIAKLLQRIAPLRMANTNQLPLDPARVADGAQKRPLEHPITEDSIISGLLELGREAGRVLRGTMCAFAQHDAHTARVIWQEDDVVDVRYHLVRHDVMTMLTGMHALPALQQDSLIMQRMTYWLWIAHNLERVGDHCTNLCERIVFFLEGDGTIRPQEPI
ncbi:MAG TPA: PhoU domain-containing protein [Ktedonobacteraceae bacterium]|jgi:phosphate transport system protein